VRFLSSCLLLLRACPRGLPLFPYTTLFRSGDHHHHPAGPVPAPVGEPATVGRTRLADVLRRRGRRGELPPAARDRRGRGLGAAADRKSTRLNSSHVSISYAVFCWKKKTESV